MNIFVQIRTMWLLRNFKAFFSLFHLHIIFSFIEKHLMTLSNLSSYSRWVSQNKSKFKFSDYYHTEFVRENKRKPYFEFIKTDQKLEAFSYLEFGVYEGHSMRWWSENNTHPETRFYGFDTFEGLPEEWGHYKKGDMTVHGNFPKIDDARIKYLKGLFQDTLIQFTKTEDLNRKIVINLDADLYSSTLFVLTVLYPFLKDGDIIMFDEFNVPNHEYRAYLDFIKSYYIELIPLAAASNFYHAAFVVKK